MLDSRHPNLKGPAMTQAAHVEELKKKHQKLSEEVELAQRQPATDELKIAEMKKQKLLLKEKITRLTQH